MPVATEIVQRPVRGGACGQAGHGVQNGGGLADGAATPVLLQENGLDPREQTLQGRRSHFPGYGLQGGEPAGGLLELRHRRAPSDLGSQCGDVRSEGRQPLVRLDRQRGADDLEGGHPVLAPAVGGLLKGQAVPRQPQERLDLKILIADWSDQPPRQVLRIVREDEERRQSAALLLEAARGGHGSIERACGEEVCGNLARWQDAQACQELPPGITDPRHHLERLLPPVFHGQHGSEGGPQIVLLFGEQALGRGRETLKIFSQRAQPARGGLDQLPPQPESFGLGERDRGGEALGVLQQTLRHLLASRLPRHGEQRLRTAGRRPGHVLHLVLQLIGIEPCHQVEITPDVPGRSVVADLMKIGRHRRDLPPGLLQRLGRPGLQVAQAPVKLARTIRNGARRLQSRRRASVVGQGFQRGDPHGRPRFRIVLPGEKRFDPGRVERLEDLPAVLHQRRSPGGGLGLHPAPPGEENEIGTTPDQPAEIEGAGATPYIVGGEEGVKTFQKRVRVGRLELAQTRGQVQKQLGNLHLGESCPQIRRCDLSTVQPALRHGLPDRRGLRRRSIEPVDPASPVGGELGSQPAGDGAEDRGCGPAFREVFPDAAEQILEELAPALAARGEGAPGLGPPERIGDPGRHVARQSGAACLHERAEDLRLSQGFGQTAQVQGESGVVEEPVPVALAESRGDGMVLHIAAGLLEASEIVRLPGQERALIDQAENSLMVLKIAEVRHQPLEAVVLPFARPVDHQSSSRSRAVTILL